MDGLLHLGLTNAAWSAVLALAAAFGRRWLRRYPAVVHALWLLVLLQARDRAVLGTASVILGQRSSRRRS